MYKKNSTHHWSHGPRRRLSGEIALEARGTKFTAPIVELALSIFGACRNWESMRHEDLHLVEFDLTDPGACIRLLEKTGATEVYNLAAQSFVGVSFDQPQTTAQITAFGRFESPWKRFAL